MTPAAPDKPGYKDVLASVDQDGRRKWVGARIVWGRWRAWRLALAIPLIVFYCAIPFVEIGGFPAVQIDLVARKLHLFGAEFWPQDLTWLVVLVLLGIIGTLLAVALLGRVFCGWFCPHNVFLEMVYRPIEHLLLGGPGSPQKTPLLRGAIMWVCFAVVSAGLANAGTALFIGADAFRWYLLLDWAAHPYATVFWIVLFAVVMFNFGWFREQTCTIVCPYGRFQTAMLDPHTLVVAYDAKRGEPRGHLPAGQTTGRPDDRTTGRPLGDCIDCGLCVRVCPTGIDIRNGNQLECIHCAACVDACDRIMDQVGRPRGLVRYSSEEQLAGRPRRILRPRTILYSVVCTALILVFGWRFLHRQPVMIDVLGQTAGTLRERDPEGRDAVRAVIPLSLINRTQADLRVRIALDQQLDARVILPQPLVDLPVGRNIRPMPIIYIPYDRFTGRRLDLAIQVLAEDGRLLGTAAAAVRRP
jgi:cytochrome c oxidase accessory protein FixG